MKKDIDKMIKCRAIFLQSIASMNGSGIVMDEAFNSLLEGFTNSYLKGNFDKFSLIYCFKIEKGKVVIHEEEEWGNILRHYLNFYLYHDDKNIIKLYDDVGLEAVDKISELVELFYEYIRILSDKRISRIKS